MHTQRAASNLTETDDEHDEQLREKRTGPEKPTEVEDRRDADDHHPAENDQQIVRIPRYFHARQSIAFECPMTEKIVVRLIFLLIQLMDPVITPFGIFRDL